MRTRQWEHSRAELDNHTRRILVWFSDTVVVCIEVFLWTRPWAVVRVLKEAEAIAYERLLDRQDAPVEGDSIAVALWLRDEVLAKTDPRILGNGLDAFLRWLVAECEADSTHVVTHEN